MGVHDDVGEEGGADFEGEVKEAEDQMLGLPLVSQKREGV